MYHDMYQHVSATYRLIHRYTSNTSLIRADAKKQAEMRADAAEKRAAAAEAAA